MERLRKNDRVEMEGMENIKKEDGKRRNGEGMGEGGGGGRWKGVGVGGTVNTGD